MATPAPIQTAFPGVAYAPTKSKNTKLPIHLKLAGGAIAGMTGSCLVFPIDMVKTQLQSGRYHGGPISVVRHIKSIDGIRGFYRGLGATLVGATPEKAIKFVVNDVLTEAFEDEHGNVSILAGALAGAGAGFFQCIATNPMEITKIRLQMQSFLPPAERLSVVGLLRNLGIKGLYQGSAATMSRDVLFSIFFFPGYAQLKKVFAGKDGNDTVLSMLSAGCISGAATAYMVTPFDVIKTRLQIPGGIERYVNVRTASARIVQEEGFKALYRGGLARVAVIAPLFGISLLIFDLQKKYMGNRPADVLTSIGGITSSPLSST